MLASPLPPSFLGTYSLSTSSPGCDALCMVISFLVLWSICLSSSLVHLRKGPEYLTRGKAQVFIPLIRFLQLSFVSSSFLVLLRYYFWILFFISTCLMVLLLLLLLLLLLFYKTTAKVSLSEKETATFKGQRKQWNETIAGCIKTWRQKLDTISCIEFWKWNWIL